MVQRDVCWREKQRGGGVGVENEGTPSLPLSSARNRSQVCLFETIENEWPFILNMIMAKYGLLVGICALFTVLICLIKFPVIFLGIWSGWKKCDRVSRLLSRSVCKRSMRAQTPQSQNVIFLLNVDNIFGPFRRVTYLWSYFVGLSLQPPPRLPTYPSPTPTAHPKKCYFY